MPRDSQAWQDIQEALAVGQRAKGLVQRILVVDDEPFLMKPIDRHELSLTVQRLLGQPVPQKT